MARRKTIESVLLIVGTWVIVVTAPFFVPQFAQWAVDIAIIATVIFVVLAALYFYPEREIVDETSPVAQVEPKRREFDEGDVGPPIPIEGVASFLQMPNVEKMLKDWLRRKLVGFCNVQVKEMDQSQDWSEVRGLVQDSNLLSYHFTLRLDSKGKIDKKKSYVK
ncbi:MAG: hypothetical protein ABSG74_10590 [Candidatus Bathyarchaeia archaeon]